MWSRLRLDIGWGDIAWGLRGTSPHDLAIPDGDLVCLSARSGFDLLLSALALPPGSEVLMSALTIPHMPAIVRSHGLVPVPVDIDPATMAPSRTSFERAVTPRARVFVVAHLLGGRVPSDEIGAMAAGSGVILVEDCAQAFDGTGCPLDELADVALYSFGTIKTATSLGGCIARVRDAQLLAEMRRIHASLPIQPSAEHRRKLAKAGLLKLISARPLYGAFTALMASNGDLDERLHRAIAGFPDDRLIERIRRRPSPSLSALLARRLAQPDRERIARRRSLGDRLGDGLGPPLELAGADGGASTHWVAPVLTPDPDGLVEALRRSGFDATRWSSMIAIPRPPGHLCAEPIGAQSVLDRAVFVPCYPELTETGFRKLTEALGRCDQSGIQPLG